MTSKKPDNDADSIPEFDFKNAIPSPFASRIAKAKRGRYARLLANGYTVEVTPSEKGANRLGPPPATPPGKSGR